MSAAMSAGGSLEERRRKSRNIFLSALILLIVLWIFKLSHPKYSIVPSFLEDSLSIHTSPSPSPKPVSKVAAGNTLSTEFFNGTIGNKAAVIIETTFRANLIPLLLHFGSVLGPSWPILIYTSAEGIGQFSTSSALGRYFKTGDIQIRTLPQDVFLENGDSVSELMTGEWLWNDLAPAEHILFFQSDSMICANAAHSVEDFFQYDFVSALIAAKEPAAYNGGLSLRKRSSVLRVLQEWVWRKKVQDKFEDQWYYNRLKKIQEREKAQGITPETEGAINLPNAAVAQTFSVQSIDYPHPLAVQEVHRWDKEQSKNLTEWCPESILCSKEPFKDT